MFKEKYFINNLFDEESGWLIFANFIKLSILSLNFNHLYLDIYNKTKLNHWENINFNKSESPANIYHWLNSIKFDEYIKKFNSLEIKFLKSFILREDILLSNISWYIDILDVNKNAGFNRFIKVEKPLGMLIVLRIHVRKFRITLFDGFSTGKVVSRIFKPLWFLLLFLPIM